jgi:hypothetical protein
MDVGFISQMPQCNSMQSSRYVENDAGCPAIRADDLNLEDAMVTKGAAGPSRRVVAILNGVR